MEKLRLELVELKLDNLLERSSDYGSWSKERQLSNSARIKEIEHILKHIPYKYIEIDKSKLPH